MPNIITDDIRMLTPIHTIKQTENNQTQIHQDHRERPKKAQTTKEIYKRKIKIKSKMIIYSHNFNKANKFTSFYIHPVVNCISENTWFLHSQSHLSYLEARVSVSQGIPYLESLSQVVPRRAYPLTPSVSSKPASRVGKTPVYSKRPRSPRHVERKILTGYEPKSLLLNLIQDVKPSSTTAATAYHYAP